MKARLASLLLLSLMLFNCSKEEDDRPLCSEYNLQSPNDDFISCEEANAPCKCG